MADLLLHLQHVNTKVKYPSRAFSVPGICDKSKRTSWTPSKSTDGPSATGGGAVVAAAGRVPEAIPGGPVVNGRQKGYWRYWYRRNDDKEVSRAPVCLLSARRVIACLHAAVVAPAGDVAVASVATVVATAAVDVAARDAAATICTLECPADTVRGLSPVGKRLPAFPT